MKAGGTSWRGAVIILSACVFLILGAGTAVPSHTEGTLGAELRPDLQTLTPGNFAISGGSTGPGNRPSRSGGTSEQRLEFDNEVANLHTGVLELVPTGDKCTTGQGAEGRIARQRIFYDANGDGGFLRNQDTSSYERAAGCMTFHAKHRHWHFDDFALFELRSLDGDGHYTVVAADSLKMTFCIADVNRRADMMASGSQFSPEQDYYTQCSRTSVQGLSVGWGDLYPRGTAGQYIVVTNVPDGTYCFVSIADPALSSPDGQLLETNEANNTASRTITLSTGGSGDRQVSEGSPGCHTA